MSDCAYADLDDDGLLQLAGRDIPAFLQGQLTCDTRAAAAEHTVPGALCTAQGRVIADLRLLLPAADRALLRLTRELREHTAAVLGRYAMFSRIEVSAEDGRWCLGALWGPGAAAAVAAACGSVPSAVNDAVAGDGWLVVRCDRAGEEFECYFSGDDGAALRETLAHGATAGETTHWRARELARGLLRLAGDQAEKHLPQALNYDLAGLVSFRKGCYTGQEVVARLHYRGRAKRRLALFRAPAGAAVHRGDPVYDDAAAERGEVLRCELAADGSRLLAALLPVGEGACCLAGGTALEALPAPYDSAGS